MLVGLSLISWYVVIESSGKALWLHEGVDGVVTGQKKAYGYTSFTLSPSSPSASLFHVLAVIEVRGLELYNCLKDTNRTPVGTSGRNRLSPVHFTFPQIYVQTFS